MASDPADTIKAHKVPSDDPELAGFPMPPQNADLLLRPKRPIRTAVFVALAISFTIVFGAVVTSVLRKGSAFTGSLLVSYWHPVEWYTYWWSTQTTRQHVQFYPVGG